MDSINQSIIGSDLVKSVNPIDAFLRLAKPSRAFFSTEYPELVKFIRKGNAHGILLPKDGYVNYYRTTHHQFQDMMDSFTYPKPRFHGVFSGVGLTPPDPSVQHVLGRLFSGVSAPIFAMGAYLYGAEPYTDRDFDSTKGYPGEGPGWWSDTFVPVAERVADTRVRDTESGGSVHLRDRNPSFTVALREHVVPDTSSSRTIGTRPPPVVSTRDYAAPMPRPSAGQDGTTNRSMSSSNARRNPLSGGSKSAQQRGKAKPRSQPRRRGMPGRRRGRGRGRQASARRYSNNPLVGRKGVTRTSVPLTFGLNYPGGNNLITGRKKNCFRFQTRMFLGTLQQLITSGNTSMKIDGTHDIGCQWYLNPGNAFYMSNSTNFLTLSRMFSAYFINSFSIEFQAQVAPGNATSVRTYYGWVQDVNLGFSTINSFTSTQQLTQAQILALPESRSFTSWQPTEIIAPPKRWYVGKKFRLRSADFDEAIQAANMTTNRDCYAFGLWFLVGSVIPSATYNVADVFVNLDIELCDMAPPMILDGTGGASFSSLAPAMLTKDENTKLKDMLSSSSTSVFSDLKHEEKRRRRGWLGDRIKRDSEGDIEDCYVSLSEASRAPSQTVAIGSTIDFVDRKERKSVSQK